MHAKGTAYAILTEEENYKYLPADIETEVLADRYDVPEVSEWVTLYIPNGKKDKINKIDIVGVFLQKGKLAKDDLGLIEVKDSSSYVAVKRDKAEELLTNLSNEKIKGKKLKLAIAK
jgi:ATP-independent RNA helicase DbpA